MKYSGFVLDGMALTQPCGAVPEHPPPPCRRTYRVGGYGDALTLYYSIFLRSTRAV